MHHGNSYTVYVQRLAKEETDPNVIDEQNLEDIKVLLKSLQIEGFNISPEFNSEVYEYTIYRTEQQKDITKLNITAVGLQEDFIVEIKGNENLTWEENIITIEVKSKDGQKTATYTIKLKIQETVAPTMADTVAEQEEITPLWTKQTAIIISILTGIITLFGIYYAVTEYRYSKNKEEDLGDIPYSKIGFDTEETVKTDILKQEEIQEEQENDRKSKNNKGKHF